ncbi:MAG: hypothetical protein RIT27_2016 [Pseudomonadota bacterium]|jgi:16S rRNA (guanine1516-N2)-methyltransferase
MFLWVKSQHSELHLNAKILAEKLNIPLIINEQLPAIKTDFYLYLTPEHLALCPTDKNLGKNLFVEFEKGKANFRRKYGGGKQQPLARAFGLHKGQLPYLIDVTAGLGRDGFVLASLGCNVQLVERSNIVWALLENGLQRAQQNIEIGEWVTKRLSLICADSKIFLRNLEKKPQAIYLDPMFPARQKTALVKKEMRIFQQLIGENNDAEELLEIALEVAQQRVVVKRPIYAPFLASRRPHAQIVSESTRFDLYFNFNQLEEIL